MRTPRGLAIIALTTTALLGADAQAAEAKTAATYRCNATSAGGQNWTIRQTDTNCAFARYATRLAVNRRRSPRNWRCFIDKEGEFGPERSDFRVRCYSGSKRILALAR